MCHRGKSFDRCPTLFPCLFMIYFVLTTSLSVAGASKAGASPSQRDIKEAEEIVGRFLRNEAGTTWLSGLAMTRSAPLTTEELMNALLADTRPGGQVWKAASILSDSLKAQAQKGIKPDTILSKPENWKDLIAHIEDQDDIICLYRKNTEETAKKADDWKKFLRTVSPGYTVHLAIDTGHKYVICLKKIEVPETHSEENVTTPTTAATSVDPPVVTVQMTLLETNSTEPNDQTSDSDQNCDEKDMETTDGTKIEAIEIDDDAAEGNIHSLLEEKSNTNKPKREMEEDLGDQFGDNIIDSQQTNSVKQKESYIRNNGWPVVEPSGRIPGESDTVSYQDPECYRPVILVVQSGKIPFGYGSGHASGVPIPQNLRLSSFSRNSQPNPAVHRPFTSSLIPQNAVPPYKFPRPLYKPPKLSNNYQQLAKVNYLGTPSSNLETPVQSQKTDSIPSISRQQMRNARVQAIAQSFMRNKKNTFLPPPLDIKSRGSQSLQQNRDNVNNLRYPLGYYIPRRDALSSDSRLGLKGVGIPTENTQWKVPTRKTLIPSRKTYDVVDPVFPSQSAKNSYRDQYLEKNRGYLFPARPPAYESTTQPIVKSQAFHNLKQSSPPSSPNFQTRNPYQIPLSANSNLRSNHRPPTRFDRQAFIRSCPLQWNALCDMAESSRSATNSLVYPILTCSNLLVCPQDVHQIPRQSIPCPNPCDRPIKLQIMINGNIQEPSKVSVISGPEQLVEVIGSEVPIMPYGSRALRDRSFSSSVLGNEVENISSMALNEKKQINSTDEEHTVDVDDKKKNEDEFEGENSSSVTTSDSKDDKLNDKDSSTTNSPEQTTNKVLQTSGSDGPDIEQRFLHETTIKANSTDLTSQVNTTMSAMTNSTVVE